MDAMFTVFSKLLRPYILPGNPGGNPGGSGVLAAAAAAAFGSDKDERPCALKKGNGDGKPNKGLRLFVTAGGAKGLVALKG